MQKKESGEKPTKAPSKTSWGAVAEWYDDLLEQSADSFQAKVIMPNLLRVLEPRAGVTVLDVACGQGYFSRAFAQNGATVVGCDISRELIDLAVKASPETIRYEATPANSLSFMADGSVDAVTIVLALQNIEDLAGALGESARVLKKGGRLLVVLNHPAFRVPQRSSWQWDEDENKQYRRIDGYMSNAQLRIDMTPGEKHASKKKFTVSFHRPLQVYFKALGKAGFAVTRLEEWLSHRQSQKGPRQSEEDRIRKEIPMFLLLEARKN